MPRFCGYVGLTLCVVFLCACGEGALEATEAGEENIKRATATKAAETSTPQASLRAPATLVIKTLPPVPTIEREPIEALPTVYAPPAWQALVDQALNDLAQRLDVGLEQIDVVEVESVVWPDGALGCPQPGMAYIQVLQEGLLIRLRVGKRVYNYHSGGGSAPFLCEKSLKNVAPAPISGQQCRRSV